MDSSDISSGPQPRWSRCSLHSSALSELATLLVLWQWQSFARKASPQPPYVELISPDPESRERASHQSRPGCGIHTQAPVQFHPHSSSVHIALFVSHHTSLPKRVPLSLHPARDSSLSIVILEHRGMLSRAVHRPQLRPQSTCRTGTRNWDVM